MLRLLIAAAFVLYASHAQAFFVRGSELAKDIGEFERATRNDAGTDYAAATRVFSYVTGVFDALDGKGLFCAPTAVTRGQASAVVVQYLKANPARWHEPARDLVVAALKGSFPC